MKGEAPASTITGVPGWESIAEQSYLHRMARILPDGAVIVEIGGEFGMSASIFSHGAPNARIYSIDLRYDGVIGQAHEANLAEANVGANVKRIAANSQLAKTVNAFKKQEKSSISILFIDGDHSYNGALNDLTLWAPLVAVGGKMILHDTAAVTNTAPHDLHFDVSRALAIWYRGQKDNWQAEPSVDTITPLTRIK